MKNEFMELISSPLMNLDHTYRYSGTKLVEPETLSQHIVDTVMLGLKLIDKLDSISQNDILVIPEIYILKAVYHDLEEVITGDIPRPLKYYNEDTLSSMKQVADEVALKLFSSEFHEGHTHYKVWDSAKDGNEGYILKIVDTLVVVNKVVKEVSLLSNHYMLRVAHEVSTYVHKIKKDIEDNGSPLNDSMADKYLLRVLEGASDTLSQLMLSHDSLMKDMHIQSASMI